MGFDVGELNPNLFGFQRDIVRWALKRGRAAIFAECGLGKSLMQLEWARHVLERTSRPVVIHCPIGVRQQTKSEAGKFGIPCRVEVVNKPADVVHGINLVNYEKLHLFDSHGWGGVVLDESSILKAFTGKIKRQLCDFYSTAPCRLCCTATPAPNDHMELGNHSDFLGVMPSNEMLSRWFINDTMRAGGYRLKGHAAKDFWEWVASWAVCVSKPSDLGYPDDGYVLPGIKVHEHVVDADVEPGEGELFSLADVSATSIHSVKRQTSLHRARKIAELVAAEPKESWLIWCDTNYEADDLMEMLPDAIECRGSDKDAEKEAKLQGFARGDFRQLVTKPEIAGFGLNYQHCARMAFVGLSFSFERYYQAVRRVWRFGQTRPVQVHVVYTDLESATTQAVKRKSEDFELMRCQMAEAMRAVSCREVRGELLRDEYTPVVKGRLPSWLSRA